MIGSRQGGANSYAYIAVFLNGTREEMRFS